jgi:uncharacterized membrane protein
MKWGRIVVAGIGVSAAVLIVITLVVTGYAFKLAFADHGPPDQARLSQLAEHLGRSYWWLFQILLTVPAAAWAARKAQSRPPLHGLLVGLVAAFIGMALGFSMSLRTIAEVGATLGAGWLGGAIVQSRTKSPAKQEP